MIAILSLTVCIALQLGDGLTTIVALRSPSLREGNPAAAWLFDRFGMIPCVVMLKLLAIALAVACFVEGGAVWLWIPSALYMWVVLDNYRLIRRAKEIGADD